MKSIRETVFWRTPFAIKLTAVWFIVLGVYTVWEILNPCVGVKCEIEICSTLWSLVSAFIYFGIAIGLITKSNGSREWAIFFVSLGLLITLLILAIAVFEDLNSTDGFQLSYDKLTRHQTIIALVAILTLHVGMLFALLRSATKAFFAPQTPVEEKQ